MRSSLPVLAIVGAATMWAGNAAAEGQGAPTVVVLQQPGYGQPPPGYGQPPPGYGQPPPAGYGQPPPGAYYAPAPGYAPAPNPGYATTPMGPRYLDYEEGDAIPAGYRTGTRVRKGLVVGGAVTLGVSYLITIFVAGIGQLVNNVGADGSRDYGPLLVPVAGPFIGIATTHASNGGAFGLAFLGVAQTAGLGMLIGGIAAPKTVLIRNEARVKFNVVPQISPTSTGLGVVGTF